MKVKIMKVKVLKRTGGYYLADRKVSLKGKVFTAYTNPDDEDVVFLDFKELEPYFGYDPRKHKPSNLSHVLGWAFFASEVEVLEVCE